MSRNLESKQSSGGSKPPVKDLADVVAILREERDMFEADLAELRLEQLVWQNERKRMEKELEVSNDKLKDFERELDVSNDKLRDLSRELAVSKESTVTAVQRYDKMLGCWKEDVESKRKYHKENLALIENEGKLEEKLKMKDEELGEVRRRNEGLEGEKAKFERVIKGKDEEIDGLVKKVCGINKELKELKERRNEGLEVEKAKMERLRDELRRKENENSELKAKVREFTRLEGVVEEKEGRIKELMKKIEQLEKGKSESLSDFLGKIDVLEKDFEELMIEKTVRIKEKEGLEKQNEELVLMLKEVEKKFEKLEGDVVACLIRDAETVERFKRSHIGKIVAQIITALDSEADSAFVKPINEQTILVNSVTKPAEAGETKLFSEEEHYGEDGTACNKKSTSPIYIQIDSDDEMPTRIDSDNEMPTSISCLRRKRESSECVVQRQREKGSSDDSLNPKCKIKILDQLVGEPVKHPPLIFASGSSDHQGFSTPQKSLVATIRKCNDSLNKNVTAPGSNRLPEYDTSKANKTRKILSPEAKEFMAKCKLNQEKNVVESVADLGVACTKNVEFCATAIYALFRQHQSSSRNGLICSGVRGFKNQDIHRVTTLANLLIDRGKVKPKSELDKLDPKDLGDCREFALRYSQQLFEIFKSNTDPFFSHLSTKLQHR